MTSHEHKRSFIMVFLFYTTLLLGTLWQTGYSAIQKVQGITPWFYDEGLIVTTVLNIFIITMWWTAVWPSWIQFQTRLTVDGITQPRFWGERHIRWHEISSVELDGLTIMVAAAQQRIKIESVYLATLEEKLAIFRQYLPPEMVPTFSFTLKD